MTVANNREYNEQVRPADRRIEKQRIGTRVVADGTIYSSQAETPVEDNLFGKVTRLRSIANRLLGQSVACNDFVHRGLEKEKQCEGTKPDSNIFQVLEETESKLEQIEKELIILGKSLGGL